MSCPLVSPTPHPGPDTDPHRGPSAPRRALARRVALSLAAALALAAPAAKAAAPAPTGAAAGLAPGFDRVSAGHAAIAWDPNVGPDNLGVPREIGCQVVNHLMSRTPSFTFTVKEKVHAALRIEDTTGKLLSLHAVAVFTPGNRLFCTGGHYDATVLEVRDWEPGTYEVHPSTDCNVQYGGGCKPTDWPADTYRFSLVDLTPKAVALPDAFTPNPLRIDGLRTDNRTEALPATTAQCYYDVNATSRDPALVLTLAHPYAHLRVYAEGGARDLLATDAAGRSACSDSAAADQQERPYVDLRDVPAGRLEVRVAGRDGFAREAHARPYGPNDMVSGVPLFAVAIEDLARPRDVTWAPTIPTLALGKGIPAPLVAAGAKPAAGPAPLNPRECDERTMGASPVALLDVARPLDKVWLRLVTTADAGLLLEGPLDADNRETADFERRCVAPQRGRNEPVGRLEMGRYAVYLGFRGEAAPFAVGFGDDATVVDPLALTLTPDGRLTLGARVASAWFGFLPERDLPADTAQGLFLAAPDALFVTPRFDLDDATASAAELTPHRGELDAAKREWPKKDEPLLVLDADSDRLMVLAADATAYFVEVKYLAEATSGPRVVPAAPRNVALAWEDAVRLATPAEAKDIAAYDKALERAEACNDRILEASGPEYRVAQGHVGGGYTVTNHYSDRVLDAAYAKCGYPAVDALQARVLKKLDASYRKRLTDGLAKVRARFAPAGP